MQMLLKRKISFAFRRRFITASLRIVLGLLTISSRGNVRHSLLVCDFHLPKLTHLFSGSLGNPNSVATFSIASLCGRERCFEATCRASVDLCLTLLLAHLLEPSSDIGMMKLAQYLTLRQSSSPLTEKSTAIRSPRTARGSCYPTQPRKKGKTTHRKLDDLLGRFSKR